MSSFSKNDLTYPNISADIIRTLMDVGYVAIGHGTRQASEIIFNGLCSARPESELPVIGLAVAKMCFGDLDSAIKLLKEKALNINPSSDIVKCFISTILLMQGSKDEAMSVVNEVVDKSSDENAVKMAKVIIGDSDKFEGK